MGVVNVTPDSFSDGGRFLDPVAAIAHGQALVAEGADIVDIGGESSRPGSAPVPADEELRRVIPVIEALAPLVRISIDTVKPEVARAAVAAGATLINDISASLHEVAADCGVGWVAMHMQGTPGTMQDAPHYEDVVAEVTAFLADRAEAAAAAGIDEVWLDPGIGFGKTVAHNLALLRHLDQLVAVGRPVVVGTSRKRFLGLLVGASDAGTDLGTSDVDDVVPAPLEQRLEASVATATWAVAAGASMVRVHDVAPTVQAVKVVSG